MRGRKRQARSRVVALSSLRGATLPETPDGTFRALLIRRNVTREK